MYIRICFIIMYIKWFLCVYVYTYILLYCYIVICIKYVCVCLDCFTNGNRDCIVVYGNTMDDSKRMVVRHDVMISQMDVNDSCGDQL